MGLKERLLQSILAIFLKSGELDERVVCANFAHTTQHGAIKGKTQEKNVKFYNLDAIISVGYRVNSQRATAFRIWATESQYRNKFAAKNRNGFDISRDGLSI